MKIIRVFLPLLLWLACVPAAYALRCDSNLTHDGDYEYQVRERCGAPFWTDTRIKYEGFGSEQQQVLREVRYTSWFYNFGSNQLIVRLVFRDGRLRGEERLGRGVEELGTSCDQARFTRGVSSGELVAYCGEPVQRNVLRDFVARTEPGSLYRPAAAYRIEQDEDYREDWLYDFGGDQLYVAHMVDDKLAGFERRRR